MESVHVLRGRAANKKDVLIAEGAPTKERLFSAFKVDPSVESRS
jgi:hypothetical protein